MRIFSLAIVIFVFMGSRFLFAEDYSDDNITEEASGWIVVKNNDQISLIYPPDVNLKRLEARLRSRYFSVSATEKDLFTNRKYDIETRILSRLESVLIRVKQILAMYPDYMCIKIKVFKTRKELNDEYYRLFGTTARYKSFYIHSLRTIYSSMQDISDSVISHEMAHAVIDHYFKVIPPENTSEILAIYVDSHLERD